MFSTRVYALFEWFDVFDLFDCLFEPDALLPALGFIAFVGVFAFLGIVVFELLFDPSAVDVASWLDSLSIDPDKWFPPV